MNRRGFLKTILAGGGLTQLPQLQAFKKMFVGWGIDREHVST